MFQKVLIAEDTNMIHTGLEKSLKDIFIPIVETAQYCDDALLKVKRAIKDKAPFDLLITDLSFEESHRNRKLSSGEELITAIKAVQPDIKIIVFSIEFRVGKIKQLLEQYQVHSYIHKGRDDKKEIKQAIHRIFENKPYLSQDVTQLLRNDENIEDIDEVDIFILKLLSKGVHQKDIPDHLEKNSYPNYRLRSVQARVNKLRELLDANTPTHLISIAKDQGLI